MENLKRFWFSLGVLLLFSSSSSSVKAENTTFPMANVNLGPIQGWRSAYFCLQNHIWKLKSSEKCSNYMMEPSGILMVNSTEIEEYCNGDCVKETREVLGCIYMSKRDFFFANKIHVPKLNNTINDACSSKQAIMVGTKGIVYA